jgi:hypothetical protein
MTTISDGATTITPILVTGWESTRTAENVLHNIVGRSDHDVTYRPAGMRAGTLECLCESLEAALQLEALAAQPKRLTLTDPDHPSIGMTFVPTADIRVTLDDETRKQATVAIDYQQVAP